MDESKSPTKLGKLPQPRGAKPLSKEKSNKDAHTQREETTTRRQGNLKLVKEEHSTGSSGAGKMRGRTSRLTRLTGRTTFGESGKGKAASSHQQQVTETPDSQGSYSTDSSPSTNRESSSPVVPGMTESSGAGGWLTLAWLNGAVLLSAGLKSGPLVCRSVEEGAEETPEVEEGSIAEQQLGLRQAEERLYRDYIHRLLKVKTGAKALRRVYRFTHACLSSIRSHSLFPSCLCSRPQSIPTTSIYASSVLCTSRTSKEHTSTSRRRDTRKTSRLGGFTFSSRRILLLLWLCVFKGFSASGEAGGERAAGVASCLCCPPEGLGHLHPKNRPAERHLPGRLPAPEGCCHQDGGAHPTVPPRCGGVLGQRGPGHSHPDTRKQSV